MRILVVSPFLPSVTSSGGRIRIFHLVRGLAAHHDVTLLTGVNDEREEALASGLQAYCPEVVPVLLRTRPRPLRVHAAHLLSPVPHYRAAASFPAFDEALRRLVGERRYDAVQFELLQLAHLAVHVRGIPKLIDMHNVESTYFRRLVTRVRPGVHQLLLLADALKLPRYQQRILRGYDEVLAVSEVDAAQLRRFAPGASISVIPNGVDADAFRPQAIAEDPTLLVFTASFTYLPNVDAAVFFAREVLPIIRRAVPDARLCLVGQRPPAQVERLRAIPGVEVTGWVPDVRPYLAKAAAAVVPIRLGSGTRLKVLEAMAMGKAVVSTTLGAEGLELTPGHDIELADGAPAFAARTVALLRDPARRARLGAQARRAASAAYSWPQVSARLDAVYRRIDAARRPAASGDGRLDAAAAQPL